MTKVHRLMALARAKGAAWPDITQSLAQMQQAVTAQGAGFWDMTSQMGMGDPQIMRDRLQGLVNNELELAGDVLSFPMQENILPPGASIPGEKYLGIVGPPKVMPEQYHMDIDRLHGITDEPANET